MRDWDSQVFYFSGRYNRADVSALISVTDNTLKLLVYLPVDARIKMEPLHESGNERLI